MGKERETKLVTTPIESRIKLIRGRKVILDEDLAELERRVGEHDQALKALIEAIRKLMAPDRKEKRKIGFTSGGGREP